MAIGELLALPAVEAARALLGWEISHTTAEGTVGGIIVETEAYHQDDPASHSFRGITARTMPMFKEAGTVYVYTSYGIHLCMNIVCGPVGRGEAVLIRALEPTTGVSLMQVRRGAAIPIPRLCSGPGNVGKALGITLLDSGTKIGKKIHIAPSLVPEKIITSSRIGISQAKEELYRFFIAGNPSVSGSKKSS